MSLARSVSLALAGLTAAGALAAQQPTKFTIRVENVSSGEILRQEPGLGADQAPARKSPTPACPSASPSPTFATDTAIRR